MHKQSSEFAGKTVRIKSNHEIFNGKNMQVKDWWDRSALCSWATVISSVSCLYYAVRTAGQTNLTDEEVLVGLIDGYEHLVHVSEVAGVIKT